MRRRRPACHNGPVIFPGRLRSRITAGVLLITAAIAAWSGRDVRVVLPGWAAAPIAVLLLAIILYAVSTRRRYASSAWS